MRHFLTAETVFFFFCFFFFFLFQNLQIPLGRRFRSLKLWFVMRSYGAEGLRDYIRKQVKLAEEFYQMLSVDDRFEFPVPPAMGLVCFRLKVGL
jgi:aromatic-L-amino-acid decarboxylase